MSPSYEPHRRERPKPKTPAERGEEFAAAQRRLKQEAADRRASAARPTAPARGPGQAPRGASR